ncbi:MAG: TonB-dependent receptor [Halieaceae bacterium]|nr:TonB-dependent receptor [Halieaceae bacterium]
MLYPRPVRKLSDTRETLSIDYARGSWSGLVRMNYYGGVYEHLFNDQGAAITTDSLTVVDVELDWEFSNVYTVSLGARNVFDNQPGKHQFAGVSGYLGADFPLNHPSGFDGGSYYLRLNATIEGSTVFPPVRTWLFPVHLSDQAPELRCRFRGKLVNLSPQPLLADATDLIHRNLCVFLRTQYPNPATPLGMQGGCEWTDNHRIEELIHLVLADHHHGPHLADFPTDCGIEVGKIDRVSSGECRH